MHDLLAPTGGTPDSGKMQAVSDLRPTFARHHLALILALDCMDGSPDGQGGWLGDREGRSEASRRGWENRRSDDGDRSQGRCRR
ncbi:MAG: hypothetical protein V4747_06565 [Pseudomonadota bacterium]